MNRVCRTMGMLAFLLYPVAALSADRIELTNGSSFTVSQYWEEGDQLKFPYYGGVVGIERSLVENIIDAGQANVDEESGYDEDRTSQKKEDPRPGPTEKTTNQPPPPEKESFLRERESIRSEIAAASDAYRIAREEGDPKLIVEKRKAVLSHQTRLNALQKRVKKAHGGTIPLWWNSDQQTTTGPP